MYGRLQGISGRGGPWEGKEGRGRWEKRDVAEGASSDVIGRKIKGV